MEKFLQIFFGDGSSQILRAKDVAIVKQTNTTTTTVTYVDGLNITITHDAAPVDDTSFRDAISKLIIQVNTQSWVSPELEVPSSRLPFAVTDISVAA